jgi:hypothetical protein
MDKPQEQVRQSSPSPTVLQPVDPFPQMTQAPQIERPAGKLIDSTASKRRVSSTQVVLILVALSTVAIIVRIAVGHVGSTKTATGSSSSQTTANPLGLPITGTSSGADSSNTNSNTYGGSDQQIQGAENSCASSPLTKC